MTAPVISEKNEHAWLISFVMPSEYSLDNLPRPNNPSIKIIAKDSETYAVIIFSGLVRESSFNEKIDLLNKYIIKNNYELDGNVQIARYDPPWTLPFLRRNELLIKIK
jgi:effector-binding domain-containing protein